MLSYTEALHKINYFDDEKEEIANAPPEWGIALLAHVSRSIGSMYRFSGYVAKGGEAIIVKAWDEELQRTVIAKFALPVLTSQETIRLKVRDHDIVVRKKKKVWCMLRMNNLMRLGANSSHKKLETEYSLRFLRGCAIQKDLHKTLIAKGISQYGYIPEVYKISRAPDLWCIMEFIDGVPLLSWCQATQDNTDIIMMFSRICHLVGLMHDYSIVHSDLKHDNILVTGDIPVIIDFNIAKNLAETDKKITNVRTMLGSELYAPPEQKKASYRRNYSSDIFTLALTLWAMTNRNDPDIEEQEDLNNLPGRVFPAKIFGFSERVIFERGCQGKYQDILEMIHDVDQIVKEKTSISAGVACLPDGCEKVQAIEKKIKTITKILSGEE